MRNNVLFSNRILFLLQFALRVTKFFITFFVTFSRVRCKFDNNNQKVLVSRAKAKEETLERSVKIRI